MRWWIPLLVVGLSICVWSTSAWSQPYNRSIITNSSGTELGTVANPVVTSNGAATAAGCTKIVANAQGVAGVDIPVDSTAGGVAVLGALSTRCGAVIANVGGGDMRCGPSTMTVTTTAGVLVPVGAKLTLGAEGAEALKCIRTTATSTTASVIEARP